MPEIVRRRAVVRGRVQGVSFRYHTDLQARRLGLVGWVRNEPDGTVVLEAQGPEEDVTELVRWLRFGSPAAVVDSVSVEERTVEVGEEGFRVTG